MKLLELVKGGENTLLHPEIFPRWWGVIVDIGALNPRAERWFPIANWRPHVHTPDGVALHLILFQSDLLCDVLRCYTAVWDTLPPSKYCRQ